MNNEVKNVVEFSFSSLRLSKNIQLIIRDELGAIAKTPSPELLEKLTQIFQQKIVRMAMSEVFRPNSTEQYSLVT